MDKAKIKAIHSDIDKAIREVGEKHGFAITGGSKLTYSDTGFTLKVGASYTKDPSGKDIDPKRAVFEKTCKFYSLKPEDYLKEVHIHGDSRVYIITGVKPKARKNSIIIKDKKTGKEYVCPPSALNNLDGSMLMEGWHRCKYCGEATPSPEEDLLCYDCRSMFGHSLFSEL